MRKAIFAAILGLVATPLMAQVRLNGAGATFPNIIYQTWVLNYNQKFDNIEINYQSIGSGGGIRQFSDKTVDFGGTDAPMTIRRLPRSRECPALPTVLGAWCYINWRIAAPLNSHGILADILSANHKWSVLALRREPGVTLPIRTNRSAPLGRVGNDVLWVDTPKVSPKGKKSRRGPR